MGRNILPGSATSPWDQPIPIPLSRLGCHDRNAAYATEHRIYEIYFRR